MPEGGARGGGRSCVVGAQRRGHESPRQRAFRCVDLGPTPFTATSIMADRALGKRQVKPNLQRSDFGYEERRSTKPAANKKQKHGDDDESPMDSAGGGGAMANRGEKDARNLTVDFTKLDMATLKRYKRHFRLKTRQNVTKTELALAVAKHFASTTVDEADTIGLFMYVSSYGKMQKPGARATIDY